MIHRPVRSARSVQCAAASVSGRSFLRPAAAVTMLASMSVVSHTPLAPIFKTAPTSWIRPYGRGFGIWATIRRDLGLRAGCSTLPRGHAYDVRPSPAGPGRAALLPGFGDEVHLLTVTPGPFYDLVYDGPSGLGRVTLAEDGLDGIRLVEMPEQLYSMLSPPCLPASVLRPRRIQVSFEHDMAALAVSNIQPLPIRSRPSTTLSSASRACVSSSRTTLEPARRSWPVST